MKLNYLLYLPEGYESSNRQWPLVLFLHGAGQTGENVERVKAAGLPKVLEKMHDFPFVVVSPQSRRGGWNTDALNAAFGRRDHALPDRPGASLSHGFEHGRVRHVGAGVHVSGAVCRDRADLRRRQSVAGQGAQKRGRLGVPRHKDRTVPVARTEAMIKALKEAGCEPKVTIYPDAGHDAWTATYNNPELYTWFLEHTRHRQSGG